VNPPGNPLSELRRYALEVILMCKARSTRSTDHPAYNK